MSDFWKKWGAPIAMVGLGTGAAMWANGKANKARRKIEGEEGFQQQLLDLERSRQQVIDPTKGMDNPYERLSVATKAAEFEAEQIDISLANTLDTIRQTGAGGATALAQAALKGKRGISDSIEKQEVENQKLKAQGTMQYNQLQVEGKKFEFEKQEAREMQQLNRMQANIDQQRQLEFGFQSAALGSFMTGLTAAAELAPSDSGKSGGTGNWGVDGDDGDGGGSGGSEQ